MLIRLQSGFHFRRGIPVRFRSALGKREIWHSLETLDRNLARTRACAMYGLTSQLFECISLAMSSSEETSSLNKAVETFQEALATSDLHPVQQDLFQSIVQTYDSEIQALKARYKTMNAEHLLARIEDHQRVSSVLIKTPLGKHGPPKLKPGLALFLFASRVWIPASWKWPNALKINDVDTCLDTGLIART